MIETPQYGAKKVGDNPESLKNHSPLSQPMSEDIYTRKKFSKPHRENGIFQKFFEEYQQQAKMESLEKKFKQSLYVNKQQQYIKVTVQNFSTILVSLARSIMNKYANYKQLFARIENICLNLTQADHDWVFNMLHYLSIKQQTFDICTNIEDIYTLISDLVVTRKHVIGRIIYDIWYDFILEKYQDGKYRQNKHLFIKDLSLDIQGMTEFVTDIIYYVFKDWFYIFEKGCDVYTKIMDEVTPCLLTSHSKWKKHYGIFLKLLGKVNLEMNKKDKDPTFFEISNRIVEQYSEHPFKNTIRMIKEFYSEYSLNKKVEKLLELAKTIKFQINQHRNDLKRSELMVDVDDEMAIFEYCILRSQKNGIYQSLLYMELFFDENQKFKMSYFQKKGIAHLIATLKGSALKLRERDVMILTSNSDFSNTCSSPEKIN